MTMSLLTELKKTTRVVADTGDILSIEKFKPEDATTNPSLIAAAAKMPVYAELVDGALVAAKKQLGASAAPKEIVDHAIDELSVEFGKRILKIVPGRVSTEVDARLSFDEAGTIAKAKKLISMYESAGVGKQRILIKIASTWEGIRAAEKLEAEGIHCNLTLLFGMHQAIACAEAKATLISPFVGRILDFFLKKTGQASYPPAEDPGVVSVTRIYEYFKHFGHQTEVMGASFRNTGEILELAGCDLLTISPKLLDELDSKEGAVPRKLDPEAAKTAKVERITVTEATFRSMHQADEMATFKLQEGIDGFTKSLVELEKQLEERLATLG
ncbi:MAG: transaldolase [Polyangiaceae bacterium]|nr:transaldolase [Polyangiaceae bacterium]MBK8936922.1 transaldolase [Polyangiaceae bacterium]